MNFVVHPFLDVATGSWSYVLANPGSGRAAVIDPVLDCDPDTGRVGTAGVEQILELIDAHGYCVEWILETHVHADHLSAARYLKSELICAQLAIGEQVRGVQADLVPRFELQTATDGSQFDRLFSDGERICLGHACGRILHTPGHTPGCVSYVFDRFVFVGDTLFQPDCGTARCDFPGGDARALYRSVQRLYALPGHTRMLVCHDYPPQGRAHRFAVSVAEQRRNNCMLSADTAEADFVARRETRDAGLQPPRLFDAALRANLSGGAAPDAACTRRGSHAVA